MSVSDIRLFGTVGKNGIEFDTDFEHFLLFAKTQIITQDKSIFSLKAQFPKVYNGFDKI